MDTNEDTGAGAGLAPTYPIYDRSGVSEVAHSFGEKPSSSAGGGVLVYDCSASDQQKLAKQTQVETIMAAVTAMRTELGRSPKDLAAAACNLLVLAFVRVLGGFAPGALSGHADFNMYTPDGILARTVVEKGGGLFLWLEKVDADGSGWGLKTEFHPAIKLRGSLGEAGYDQILAKIVEGYLQKPVEASDIQKLIDRGREQMRAAATAQAQKVAETRAVAASLRSEQFVQHEVGNSLAELAFEPKAAPHAGNAFGGTHGMGAARK